MLLRSLLAAYAVMSVITFGVYGVDKRRAMLSARRIPERTLHLLELFFGWPGAAAGQAVFHHKTRKPFYQFIFFTIIALHIAMWISIYRFE